MQDESINIQRKRFYSPKESTVMLLPRSSFSRDIIMIKWRSARWDVMTDEMWAVVLLVAAVALMAAPCVSISLGASSFWVLYIL